MMTDRCMFCDKEVRDYKPIYCCDGYECGCRGLPVEPPMHEHCVIVDFLQRLKKFCSKSKGQNISICMRRSYPEGTIRLEDHSKQISSEDITLDEAEYVMACQGFTNGVDNVADYIIEQLGGILPEENPEKIVSRSHILDL